MLVKWVLKRKLGEYTLNYQRGQYGTNQNKKVNNIIGKKGVLVHH